MARSESPDGYRLQASCPAVVAEHGSRQPMDCIGDIRDTRHVEFLAINPVDWSGAPHLFFTSSGIYRYVAEFYNRIIGLAHLSEA